MRRPLMCVGGCGQRLGTWKPRPETMPGRVFFDPVFGLRGVLVPRNEDDFVIETLAFLTVDDVAEIREGIYCAVCYARLGPREAAQVDASVEELERDRRRASEERRRRALLRS